MTTDVPNTAGTGGLDQTSIFNFKRKSRSRSPSPTRSSRSSSSKRLGSSRKLGQGYNTPSPPLSPPPKWQVAKWRLQRKRRAWCGLGALFVKKPKKHDSPSRPQKKRGSSSSPPRRKKSFWTFLFGKKSSKKGKKKKHSKSK